MRFIVYGAGAIGGVVGGRLQEAGHDVVLIARGAHFQAMREHGLRIDAPAGSVTLPVNVVDDPRAIEFTADDVVLLCMKGQDTEDALRVLAGAAPAGIGVVSVQNGVANEPVALRYFANVYGVCVICPALHVEPGVVEANWDRVTGLLDIGRYPRGVDSRAETVSEVFVSATFESVPRTDIMRWKYGKLLNNLVNAVDALCGRQPRVGELGELARAEGIACLDAAGIAFVDRPEDAARRGDGKRFDPGAGARRGSSSWQSLARGTGSIEADHLNGEIVMLGRKHGIPTPVNETLQLVANRAAREQWAPGAMELDQLIRLVPLGE